MSDHKHVRKGGFGAFTAIERERKAASELAARGNAPTAATNETDVATESVVTTVGDAPPVPWPLPHSLGADAESAPMPQSSR